MTIETLLAAIGSALEVVNLSQTKKSAEPQIEIRSHLVTCYQTSRYGYAFNCMAEIVNRSTIPTNIESPLIYFTEDLCSNNQDYGGSIIYRSKDDYKPPRFWQTSLKGWANVQLSYCHPKEKVTYPVRIDGSQAKDFYLRKNNIWFGIPATWKLKPQDSHNDIGHILALIVIEDHIFRKLYAKAVCCTIYGWSKSYSGSTPRWVEAPYTQFDY